MGTNTEDSGSKKVWFSYSPMLYYSTHSGCDWHSAAVMGHILNTQ